MLLLLSIWLTADNKESFLKYFEVLNNINNLSFYYLLDNYIFGNNIDGPYAGDIEFAAPCKKIKIRIIILIEGFLGFNIYKAFIYNSIYIIYKWKSF